MSKTAGMFVGLALFIAALNLIVTSNELGARFIPRCQEDQVLTGVGDFEDGRWTSYECGPAADDFAPFSDTQLQACGEAWYHTMAALDEALIRLEDAE